MTTGVLIVVLLAACLHASWNALVKASADKGSSTVLVAGGSALLAVVFLPFVTWPAAPAWPFILGSVVAQSAYFPLVAAAYRAGDMSHAYPVMRGTAPFLVALASGLVIGEHLPPAAWAGIGCICGGILALVLTARGGASGQATGFALANALVIASYTVIDGIGVRRSGAPIGYTLWIFALTALPLLGWTLWRQPRTFLADLRRRFGFALLGGAGTLGSYGLALWAMTRAPVAEVAALRESSILFATGLSALFLGERVGAKRAIAVSAIAAGAAIMRLA